MQLVTSSWLRPSLLNPSSFFFFCLVHLNGAGNVQDFFFLLQTTVSVSHSGAFDVFAHLLISDKSARSQFFFCQSKFVTLKFCFRLQSFVVFLTWPLSQMYTFKLRLARVRVCLNGFSPSVAPLRSQALKTKERMAQVSTGSSQMGFGRGSSQPNLSTSYSEEYGRSEGSPASYHGCKFPRTFLRTASSRPNIPPYCTASSLA